MKVSTKIKKYSPEAVQGDEYGRLIIFMVDCEMVAVTKSFSEADKINEHLTKDLGYALLPINECPVYNSINQVIMHYTSTTYKDWLNI